MNCLRCKGTMSKGILADYIGSSGQLISAKWINEETPKKARWSGAYKVPDNELFKVSGLKCDQCGYLELYASK